jgi:ribosomal protein S18 acetylase RimI-like enzyme
MNDPSGSAAGGLSVRPLAPDDLPAVRALLRAIGWADNYIEGQAGSLAALVHDPHGQALVAVAGEAVIGFVSVLFAPWNRLAQVHGLAVAPASQRRGVASTLIAAAEAFARQQGGRGVFVDTPIDNVTARAFYTANGYREAYVMPEYYAEGLDGVTYLKLFGRAAAGR